MEKLYKFMGICVSVAWVSVQADRARHTNLVLLSRKKQKKNSARSESFSPCIKWHIETEWCRREKVKGKRKWKGHIIFVLRRVSRETEYKPEKIRFIFSEFGYFAELDYPFSSWVAICLAECHTKPQMNESSCISQSSSLLLLSESVRVCSLMHQLCEFIQICHIGVTAFSGESILLKKNKERKRIRLNTERKGRKSKNWGENFLLPFCQLVDVNWLFVVCSLNLM